MFEDKIHIFVVSGYIGWQIEYITSSIKQSIQFLYVYVAQVNRFLGGFINTPTFLAHFPKALRPIDFSIDSIDKLF